MKKMKRNVLERVFDRVTVDGLIWGLDVHSLSLNEINDEYRRRNLPVPFTPDILKRLTEIRDEVVEGLKTIFDGLKELDQLFGQTEDGEEWKS
jgi:hypothetical protein